MSLSVRAPWWPAAAGTLALVALAAFAYAPLFGGGMILTADTLHAWRIFEMGRCLDDGQLPCRWVPDLGNGYGYPLFNYYPPLPYYAGDLLHRLGLSYLRTVDALFAIGLIGAGLSMFVLARRLWGELGGLVSAVAYVYAPYLALDVYMRGALAELWALAVVPALLWSVHEVVTTGRRRYVPLVALCTGLLLLSHSLVAVIVAPLAVLWALALLATGRSRPDAARPALLGGAGALWGVGLAAFFTLPVLFEGSQVQLDSLTEWPFHYGDHFASVGGLFFDRSADYAFLLGASEETPVQIGWFHWALAGLSLPAGALLLRSGRRREAAAVLVLAVAFAIGVFMSVSASRALWDAFDPLRFLQFPWRYLGLVSLAAAALAGAPLALLRGRAYWVQLGVAGALIALFIGGGRDLFQPLYRFDVTDAAVFSGPYREHYQRGSIRDYLPADVAEVPSPPTAPAHVVTGDADVREIDAGSDWSTLQVDAAAPSTVEAALYDYPNWRVRIDGETVAHRASDPSGLITFDVPPGEHDVHVELEDTGVRRAGNWLSLASWSALALSGAALLISAVVRRRAVDADRDG